MFNPKNVPPKTYEMASLFFKLAGPSALTNTLDFSCSIVNVVFAGRLGDITLMASVGLAGSITTMILTSVIQGLNGAQEVLTS